MYLDGGCDHRGGIEASDGRTAQAIALEGAAQQKSRKRESASVHAAMMARDAECDYAYGLW